jgi:ubiquinone/menaquinone biosynthesis C-methylase UbiE
MRSAEQKLQVSESRASKFDFDLIADRYDRWYASRRGEMYDRLEKRLIAHILPGAAEGRRALEVGCGTGHWSRFLSEYGFEVTAIDISERMIDVALQKDIANITFHIGDGHLLPFANSSFDLTAAITTLEFVRDPHVVLREMIRCTRRPGRVLVGVLNRLSKINRKRQASPESTYAAARLFSTYELKEFLKLYGPTKIAVGGFVPARRWLIPFSPFFDRIARVFGNRKGAFIAAVLQL